jgi:hypothetical protein
MPGSNTTCIAQWNVNPIVDAGNDQTVVITGNSVPWTPADATSLTAWYDANEASTIHEDNTPGFVSKWDDKSGNGYDLIQSSGSKQPDTGINTINDLNAIRFENTDFIAAEGLADIVSTEGFTIITVAKFDSSLGTLDEIAAIKSTDGSDFLSFRRDSSNPRLTSNFGADGAAANWPRCAFADNSDYADTVPFIGMAFYDNNSQNIWGNGGVSQATKDAIDNANLAFNIIALGRYGSNAAYASIGEAIFLKGFDVPTRQKIEGYLAHKWKIEDKLPSDHPYKNDPPMKSVASAVANLDGTVTDADDTPTTTWSKVSGPGNVVFGNASDIDTTATIDAIGTYVLRLTADDGNGPITDDVVITVKLDPTVDTWPTASAITYGQTLADSTLTGGSASVPGTFTFTTPGTAPNAGTASQDVTFTPDDQATYNIVTGTVDVTCNKATPTVNTWPTSTPITFGQTLADSTLSGGDASVPGSFAFNTPATAPNVGTASQGVTFTPTDTTNYNTVAGNVDVTCYNDSPHPADTDNNWKITQSEVSAYITSQYQGNATTGGSRVTMRDVMRAIYLYNGSDAAGYIGDQPTYDGYDIEGAGDPAPETPVAVAPEEAIIVSSNADSGAGSLRNAIAMATDGETLTIDASLDTITLLSEIVIDKSITIDGQGVAIVSGGNATRIFCVENTERDIIVTLQNMGITDADNSTDEFGGAIYNNGQTLTVDTVLFDGNSNTTENGKGGAIYSSGTLTVDNCVFQNNTAVEENDIYSDNGDVN